MRASDPPLSVPSPRWAGEVPTVRLVYAPGRVNREELERAARLGCDHVAVPVAIDSPLLAQFLQGEDSEGPQAASASPGFPLLHRDGREDSEESALEHVGRLLQATPPSIRLIVEITTDPPEFWSRAHPEDLALAHDGSTRRPLPGADGRFGVASLASRGWRRAMRRSLERLVESVERSPLGPRVTGYVLRWGEGGSWIHPGTSAGHLFDYNAQAAVRYGEWLARRYGSPEAIGAAWGRSLQAGSTGEGIGIPLPQDRAGVDPRGFRHPLRQRAVIDYLVFLAELTADAATDAVAAVRRACGPSRLVGVRTGDFLNTVAVQDGLQHSGQLGLRRVLEDPGVDLLVAPAAQDPPDVRLRDGCSSCPEASVLRHGKRLAHACEAATSEAMRNAVSFAATRGHALWWEPDGTARAAVARVDRDQGVEEALAPLRTASRGHGHAHPARIALVLDDLSMAYVQRPAQQFVRLMRDQAFELARTRMPFDVILLDDLLESSSYRLLLFPNLFFTDARRRSLLHALLQGTGAMALWIGGPGFVDETAGFENIEKVVGIHIRKPPRPHTAVIVTGRWTGGVRYGNPRMHAHSPIVSDESAVTIGWYADSGLPGLAFKEMDGWRSVFSGAPAVCAALLRFLARESGTLRDEDAP